MPRQDQAVADLGLGNTVYSALHRKYSQNSNNYGALKVQRTGVYSPTALSGSPTADTTANSKTITVSDATGIAIGDFLNVAGGMNLARVEAISGLSLVMDAVASNTVSGGALTRSGSPALDVSDEGQSSGNSYVQRLYMGRFGSSAYFTRAFARDVEVYNLNGSGIGYFAAGVKLNTAGSTMSAVFSGTGTLTFGSIAAGGSEDLVVTVTGATTSTGSVAFASPQSSLVAGLSWCARVSGTNNVTVRVVNSTAGPITPAAVVWRATVLLLA
jgi:hypothetical protein